MADTSYSLLATYREVLRAYASEAQIAGVGISSEAIPLEEIFVEPQVACPTVGSHVAEAGQDLGFGGNGPEPRSERGEIGTDKESGPEPALQVFQRGKPLVILGEPGQGKTTLLRQYAVVLIRDPSARVPILVEFKQHREELDADRPLDWLRTRLPDAVHELLCQDNRYWEFMVKIVQEGKAAILLDGYDELTLDAQRQVQHLVPTLLRDHNHVVLSSRPSAYRYAPLTGFAQYQLQELCQSQIVLLATNLCRALSVQFQITDFQPIIQRVLQLDQGPAASLARNPLLLSFLCFTAFERQRRNQLSELPNQPALLIRECLDALVAWHQRKGGDVWPEHLQAEDVVRILKPLALAAFENGTRIIKQEYLSPQSEKDREISDQDREIFFRFLLPARLVERQGSDYAFPLETFGEYFVARGVAACDDPCARIREHLHDPAWERVILLTAGCFGRDRAHIVVRELPTLTWWLRKISRVATRVVSARLPKGGREAAEEGGKLLIGAFETWDARSRQSAEFFVTWVSRHGYRLWPFWERRFHYERILKRDVRMAARCLGMWGRPPASLVHELVHPTLESWRKWETQQFLHAVQEASSAPSVRDYLISLARHAKDRYLSEAALKALEVNAGEPEVIKCLLDLINDTDESVSYRATQTLANAPFVPMFCEDLLNLTRDDRWLVREAAIYALIGGLPDCKILQRMFELVTDKNRVVGRTAAYALSRGPLQPEILKALLRFTRSRDGYFRRVAVKGLARALSDSNVRRCVLRLARDKDHWISAEAVHALSAWRTDPEVKACLQEIASGEDSATGEATEPHPSGLGVSEACEGELEEDLGSDLDRVEDAAMQIPDDKDETINRVLKLSHSTDGYGRRNIARALRRFASHPLAWKRLIELTNDKSSEVRSSAFFSLEPAASEPEVWKHLVKLGKVQSKDYESEDLREQACYSLRGAATTVTPDMLEQVAALAHDSEAAWETLDILVRAWEGRKPH
jgi:HEAT repeat protein/energy-coupling factor transporter ATP-binding protein EcfA2